MIYYILIIVVAILAAVITSLNKEDLPPPTKKDPLTPKPLETLFESIDSTPDSPVGFGYKNSWLAIKTGDAQTVLDSLPFENLQPANWQTGVFAAYNGHTFITPPLNGWVLLTAYNLPGLGFESESNQLLPLMRVLSQIYGEVQYFSTHRVVGYHAWARYINGSEIRAFSYLGEQDEILVDRGAKTDEEDKLGYEYFDPESPDADSDSYWEREDLCAPDEIHVMELAGLWSINPSNLEEQDFPQSAGWIGELVLNDAPPASSN